MSNEKYNENLRRIAEDVEEITGLSQYAYGAQEMARYILKMQAEAIQAYEEYKEKHEYGNVLGDNVTDAYSIDNGLIPSL